MLPEPFASLPLSGVAPFRVLQGASLFRASDPSKGCFYLITGEMRLVRWSRDGRGTIIHVARAGETFAEAALFSPHYHCDAVAVTESSGHILRKTAINSAFKTNPRFALAFSACLARQVQDLRHRVELSGIRSADDRILAALSNYMVLDSGEFLGLPPLKVLASQIGMTHEALYRSIARLVGNGRLIRAGRGQIKLPELRFDKPINSD